jgi:hypothetical protein
MSRRKVHRFLRLGRYRYQLDWARLYTVTPPRHGLDEFGHEAEHIRSGMIVDLPICVNLLFWLDSRNNPMPPFRLIMQWLNVTKAIGYGSRGN